MLDPYAKGIARETKWSDSVWGYKLGDERADLSFDERDSAACAPLAAVIDEAFTWGDDRPPQTPWNKTIIYEMHVKGFTKLHPEVPEKLRGTYAGLGSEAVVRYLRELGITAIELLPVQDHVDDRQLVDRGLTNYWGYNTLAFFAPELEYSSTPVAQNTVREFKTMVKTMHSNGIEVILDVVYNHTAEGNHMGPTLSFRGIDNASYYRLSEKDPRYYMDFTGCGNTFRMQNPHVLQLIVDSLRYWVLTMHVDGFRFDLASTLARELYEVNMLGGFFDIIHQDPVLSQVKLIAEPWDLGQGGYQVGSFPALWSEWNGRYRDSIRKFWKGDGGMVSEFATRFTGSSDLYEWSGRRPHASINFVTSHDGFTLNDLVSYNAKHNQDNGEDNRDGDNNNHSWNCGCEGPTDDPAVNRLREKKMRSILATLLLSQGVPMLQAGDEIGRTQRGNNNAYCHDNELTWLALGAGRTQDGPLEVRSPRGPRLSRAARLSPPPFLSRQGDPRRRSPRDLLARPFGPGNERTGMEGFLRALPRRATLRRRDRRGRTRRTDLRRHHAADVQRRSRQHHSLHVSQARKRRPLGTGLRYRSARTGRRIGPPVGQTYDLEPCSVAVFRSKVPRAEEAGRADKGGIALVRTVRLAVTEPNGERLPLYRMRTEAMAVIMGQS